LISQHPLATDFAEAPVTEAKPYLFILKCHTMKTQTLGPLSHVLQDDASEDGAAAQHQGQQAHERHQHVQELPGVAFS